ncbi:MAG: hypothetical protein ACYCV7_03880 [Acidimicrobiales bacterium]
MPDDHRQPGRGRADRVAGVRHITIRDQSGPGFHSADAALALIMVTSGPIGHVLRHERRPRQIPGSTYIEAGRLG